MTYYYDLYAVTFKLNAQRPKRKFNGPFVALNLNLESSIII